MSVLEQDQKGLQRQPQMGRKQWAEATRKGGERSTSSCKILISYLVTNEAQSYTWSG